MKNKGNKSFLNEIPSCIQAILWVFASTIVLFGLGEGVVMMNSFIDLYTSKKKGKEYTIKKRRVCTFTEQTLLIS